MLDDNDLITTAQATQVAHLCQDTILARVREGKLRAKKAGNKFLFRRKDVEALLKTVKV